MVVERTILGVDGDDEGAGDKSTISLKSYLNGLVAEKGERTNWGIQRMRNRAAYNFMDDFLSILTVQKRQFIQEKDTKTKNNDSTTSGDNPSPTIEGIPSSSW